MLPRMIYRRRPVLTTPLCGATRQQTENSGPPSPPKKENEKKTDKAG